MPGGPVPSRRTEWLSPLGTLTGTMGAWRYYRVSMVFDVPLRFAFRWCTEYTPLDGRYGGEDRTIHLKRRIIERGTRRVVFENLYDEGHGWGWERHVVSLFPPNRWHSVGVGNFHESILDYTLTPVSPTRTRFDMRWKSRPPGLARGSRPPIREVEAYVSDLWTRRARALRQEYRAHLRRGKS